MSQAVAWVVFVVAGLFEVGWAIGRKYTAYAVWVGVGAAGTAGAR